ncbi:MAG: type II toxin-antitoxin system RelE/ParE family toxin [Limisphaerales bacterium]
MPNYELAEAAEADLKSIALYTISKWGARQAARYGAMLDSHFEAIGKGKARSRIFLQHRPGLRVSRMEHHYVFHLNREGQCPLILAVFHENMDLMVRLGDRLGDGTCQG